MDPLLKRQIRKYLPQELRNSEDLKPFLDAIDGSYKNFEDQSSMIQRAMMISSQELFEANNLLKQESLILKEVINRLKKVISSINTKNTSTATANDKELDTNELVNFLDHQTREIVEMSTQREELVKNLAQKNQELNDYAHMVSHDLKSPLRNINALTSWLKEDYHDKFDAQGESILELIDNNVEKMDALINGILDYSTIGEIKAEFYDVDLNNLIHDIQRVVYIPKSIEITVDSLPIVKGDRFRMQQLFQNLIDNAIKYNDKKKGIITISSQDLGDSWKFIISDNGKGIDKKYHDKIFDTFQKLDNNDNSTGIGLSIIKKVVQFYGGTIWVESVLNQGTTFFFTIKK